MKYTLKNRPCLDVHMFGQLGTKKEKTEFLWNYIGNQFEWFNGFEHELRELLDKYQNNSSHVAIIKYAFIKELLGE